MHCRASISPSTAASMWPCRVLRAAASRRCCRLSACSIRPPAASYTLNGKPVANLDFAERSRIRNQEIGFIFQSFNLIGDLTVYENVELPLTYRQSMSSVRAQAARHGVARESRNGAPPAALSVAALRRSAAARCRGACTGRKAIDPAGGRADRKPRLAQWRSRDGAAAKLHREGATICMVTHDPRFASTRNAKSTSSTEKWSRKRTF